MSHDLLLESIPRCPTTVWHMQREIYCLKIVKVYAMCVYTQHACMAMSYHCNSILASIVIAFGMCWDEGNEFFQVYDLWCFIDIPVSPIHHSSFLERFITCDHSLWPVRVTPTQGLMCNFRVTQTVATFCWSDPAWSIWRCLRAYVLLRFDSMENSRRGTGVLRLPWKHWVSIFLVKVWATNEKKQQKPWLKSQRICPFEYFGIATCNDPTSSFLPEKWYIQPNRWKKGKQVWQWMALETNQWDISVPCRFTTTTLNFQFTW